MWRQASGAGAHYAVQVAFGADAAQCASVSGIAWATAFGGGALTVGVGFFAISRIRSTPMISSLATIKPDISARTPTSEKRLVMDWHTLRQARQVNDLIAYTREPQRRAQTCA